MMIERIEVDAFLEKLETFLILDVRSPKEYKQGNIPGSINVPLFTDREREGIGILYDHHGREAAIIKGLDICLPKTNRYLNHLKRIASPEKILLYCWRGGMRSAMMAEVFSAAGYRTSVLSEGYKSYRRFIREQLAAEARIVVLGGDTGSGKTDLLHELRKSGEQVIDLEHLAHHRGSVFGAFGQETQPTNEQFENELFACWQGMDRSRIVWMEDESRMIGNVTLPDPVIEKISSGILVRVEIPLSVRLERLVREYSGYRKKDLANAIRKLRLRMGGTQTLEALQALDDSRFEEAARILLTYYDKAYQHSLDRRSNKTIHTIALKGDDPSSDAGKILRSIRNLRLG
jgi:tRNA 2-selenouridine synthase